MSSENTAKGKVPALKVRSVFISDVHLGTRECSAEYLLDFLHSVECENLYLVGDIVDMWSLTRTLYWPQSHTNVIRTILGKAKHGTRVIYEFDNIIKASPVLEYVGNRLYDFILWLNRHVNSVRRIFGYPYWSVATFLKSQMKDAMKYIHNFERALASEARKRGVDGVICGHIHRAEVTQHDDVMYCNDGDWVESCTTLVEDHAGNLSLLRWTENREVILDATSSMPLIDRLIDRSLDRAA
jgi:UDP-2,3-diacylglucosamine pyrophosphatase LpxH